MHTVARTKKAKDTQKSALSGTTWASHPDSTLEAINPSEYAEKTEIIGPCASGLAIGMEAGAIFRPEAVEFARSGEGGLPARVMEVVYLGGLLAIRLALPSGQEVWRRCFPGTDDPVEGRDVRLSWRTEDVRIVPLDNQPTEVN